jgi:hypothetical protein
MKLAFGAFVGCLLAVNGPAAAAADSVCPHLHGKSVTLISSGAVGGGSDTYARIFAPLFENVTDGTVIIKNIQGGSGKLALRALLNAKPDGLTFGIIPAASLVIEEPGDAQEAVTLADLAPLATAFVDDMVWVSNSGFELAPDRDQPLLLGTYDQAFGVVYNGATARALGLDFKSVSAYSGSSNLAAAAIRGEIDAYGVSSETADRSVRGEDLKILFTLTNKPAGDGSIPHLGGPDGLVAKFRSGDEPEVVSEALELADAVGSISRQLRSFVVSTKVPEQERACLQDLVWKVLSSEEFKSGAADMKRSVTPLTADETVATLQEMDRAQEKIRPIADEILAQSR